MNVLCIGNSFCACLHRQLPPLAEAEGRKLALATLSIAGCTLDRHAGNLAKSSADPSFRPYGARCSGFPPGEWREGEFKASMGEMLARGGWDVVTIQQGSGKSWDYATYQPHGHAVVEAVRKACPKAEVVLQQTWAYRADDVCIRDGGLWGFGQDEMAERVFAAYDRFAADKKIARLIPAGRAVGLSRRRETPPFRPYAPAALAACRWPDLPSQAGDAVSAEHLVNERYRDDDPWYSPWSPNASGSGRIVLMLLEGRERQ